MSDTLTNDAQADQSQHGPNDYRRWLRNDLSQQANIVNCDIKEK